VLLLPATASNTFCAGASLKQFQSGDMSGELFSTLTDSWRRCRSPPCAR